MRHGSSALQPWCSPLVWVSREKKGRLACCFFCIQLCVWCLEHLAYDRRVIGDPLFIVDVSLDAVGLGSVYRQERKK